MDGNGRWAEERGLQRSEGHLAGSRAVLRAARAANEIGLEYLTLYAFSTENWKRPKAEIDALMSLLDRSMDEYLPEMMRQNLRLRFIGRISGLPERIQSRINDAVDKTAGNTAGQLVIAMNYGGRSEIVDAAKKISESCVEGILQPEQIDEKLFAKYLYAPDIPDPDLLIRTSGESRISNFLLWQISYSELLIMKKHWPDFDEEDLRKAKSEYESRNRRFGGND